MILACRACFYRDEKDLNENFDYDCKFILKNYVNFLLKPIDKGVKRMYNYKCKQKVYTEFIQKMRK